MTLFAVFATESDEVVEGDDVATLRGWHAFAIWTGNLGEGYPLLAALGEEGTADDLGGLESELEHCLTAKPNDPSREVLGVGRRLLAVLSDAPEGAQAVVITDGTEPDGDEDGDEGEDGEDDLAGGSKALGCGSCGPSCSCTGCKSAGGHPCDTVPAADRQECLDVWAQLEGVQEQLDLLRSALDAGESLAVMHKAVSGLAEATGGALVSPAAQGEEPDDGDRLRGRLKGLEGVRDRLWERLLELGVEALWGPRGKACEKARQP
jgi:hypothetical protein